MTTTEYYIISGPTTVGPYIQHLRKGEFVIAFDHEYANGGFGPCVGLGGKKFSSRLAAEAELERINRQKAEDAAGGHPIIDSTSRLVEWMEGVGLRPTQQMVDAIENDPMRPRWGAGWGKFLMKRGLLPA